MFHEVLTKGLMDPDCKNNFTLPFFIDIIEALKNFEEKANDVFNELFEIRQYKKGELIVEAGSMLNHFFFVEKGILRSYKEIDNRERTIQFTFPAEFTGAYSNTILGIPCDVTIQAISDTTVWVFSWEKWDKYKYDYPELNLFERFNSASYMLALNQRIEDQLFLSSYERYEKLLERRPQIVKNLPLKYIADYLGCTIENLSRIRAKFSK